MAFCLGIKIIFEPLTGIKGFYKYFRKTHVICIDSGIPEKEQYFVCAHEIGHYLLHQHINAIFMDTNTLLVGDKIENEAHKFALELLYGYMDPSEFEGWSGENIQSFLGIGPEVFELWRREELKRDKQLGIKWQ